MKNILIIQTAFIGDVILATAIAEELHQIFSESSIDFMVRKGNEVIFRNNPLIRQVLVWDKKDRKYHHLFKLIKSIRSNRYDLVVNMQRFLSSGLVTVLSRAKHTTGFSKNPLSFLFSKSYSHSIDPFVEIHEVERNFRLISEYSRKNIGLPKIYLSDKEIQAVTEYTAKPYICIAPASIWFTKQFPLKKWVEFITQIPLNVMVYLIGSKDDIALCDEIINTSGRHEILNLAGKLDLLQSTALMKEAVMNFVNDSAPLHLASAINAKVCAIFCSTVMGFGFGPLSDRSFVAEINEKLDCRPCGLHGKKACPEKHFRCGNDIDVNSLLQLIK
jgi:ADP-heptose:LPS heptosyltransferase